MLKNNLFLIILCISTYSISQDYIEQIVDGACSCVDKAPELLGTCIINESLNYEEEILRDYGIDARLISPENSPVLLGTITSKMSGKCPETLQRSLEALKPHMSTNSEAVVEEETYYGTIKSYSDTGVLSYMVENEQGEVRKFVVLGPIECNIKIEDSYKSLVGKEVGIMFFQKKIFDPSTGNYISKNIISVLGIR